MNNESHLCVIRQIQSVPTRYGGSARMADLTTECPYLIISKYGEARDIVTYILDNETFTEIDRIRIQPIDRRGSTIPVAHTREGKIVLCCYRHIITCWQTEQRKKKITIACLPDDICISGEEPFYS